MRIVLDAMGTDNAPVTEVRGALLALQSDPDLRVILTGDQDLLTPRVEESGTGDRIRVVHAPQRVHGAEPPVSAVRRSPNSSIRVGLDMQRAGQANAFVSAGSTGAVMAASLLTLGRLRGVDRPALGTIFPTSRGPTLVADAGANLDCKSQHLVQFARLGTIYMQDIQGVREPRVGLLNVGSEAAKGTEVLQETYRALAASDLEFVGNIEGRDILRHACDVLVCDGLVGNIMLKFYESLAQFLARELGTRLNPVGLDRELEDAFRVFDYAEYGGAPLLGVNGVSVICHGGSSPKAISAAIGVAARSVRSGMVAHIARDPAFR